MSDDIKIDVCDSCGNTDRVRLVKREWLGRFWWCNNCEDLFPIPPDGEGAGAYVGTIRDGLEQWMKTDPDQGAYAEHEVLYMIKAVIDTWYAWEQSEYESDTKEDK